MPNRKTIADFQDDGVRRLVRRLETVLRNHDLEDAQVAYDEIAEYFEGRADECKARMDRIDASNK